MSAAFSTGPTYADNGSFASQCKFLVGGEDGYEIGTKEYDFEFKNTPGVDGNGSVSLGFRNQRIVLRVCYVDTSEANIISAWQSDTASMGSAPTTLTFMSQTFYACFLDGRTRLGRVRATGHSAGTFYAVGEVIVNSKRLTA